MSCNFVESLPSHTATSYLSQQEMWSLFVLTKGLGKLILSIYEIQVCAADTSKNLLQYEQKKFSIVYYNSVIPKCWETTIPIGREIGHKECILKFIDVPDFF